MGVIMLNRQVNCQILVVVPHPVSMASGDEQWIHMIILVVPDHCYFVEDHGGLYHGRMIAGVSFATQILMIALSKKKILFLFGVF